MWPILTGTGTSEARLERGLVALCDVVEDHLALMTAGAAVRSAGARERAVAGAALTRSPFVDPFERLLRDGAAEGSLRAIDPRDGATPLVNLVGQTYLHLRTGHRWAPKRARSATLDLALRGVLAR